MMIREFSADLLRVRIYDTRREMGEAAGADCAAMLRKLLEEKETVNMIFAAAPSQSEILAALCSAEGIDWSRVNAFHMDEYIGLSADATQGFGNFLRRAIFDKLPFRAVYYIQQNGMSDGELCERYTRLLKEHPVDIVCLGIGENGHIAFNDPGVADFSDPAMIKRVMLDEVCRHQQVNDGCFAALEQVPRYALTLTVPALAAAGHLYCTVPSATKADAVYKTVHDAVGEELPATVMRRHPDAALYCDRDSGAGLLKENA